MTRSAVQGYEVVPLGGGCLALDHLGCTVATVSSQGNIDWLLRSPGTEGPRVRTLYKETHLSYVLGLKLMLTCPTPETHLTDLTYRVEDAGDRLVLVGRAGTTDGSFVSQTTAALGVGSGPEYEWELETVLACQAAGPVEMAPGPVDGFRWLEYNNIYPARAGMGMMRGADKAYTCTVMVDGDGTAWEFPHQHLMHYSEKISTLDFASGTLAGFFGEPGGSPVVEVSEAGFSPDWGICEMYYDLHCMARAGRPVEPGEELRFRYKVRYLDRVESEALLARARRIPVDQADRRRHDYPRLGLGLNTFTERVGIDRCDDACGFVPDPPGKVWDRELGHSAKGSLRLTNDEETEIIWPAQPDAQASPGTTLRIVGKAKTLDVDGPGVRLRVRSWTWRWHPNPHVEWLTTVESDALSGTSGEWVTLIVPPLAVGADHLDHRVSIEVVLAGRGTAWVTDIDLHLEPNRGPAPRHEHVPRQEHAPASKPGRRRRRSPVPAGTG